MPDQYATDPEPITPPQEVAKECVEQDYIPTNHHHLLDTAIDIMYAFINLRAAVLTNNQQFAQDYELSNVESDTYIAALKFLTQSLSQEPSNTTFFIKKEETEYLKKS
jgi:hypothetical protein